MFAIKFVDGSIQTSHDSILKTFYEHFKNIFTNDFVGDYLLPIIKDCVVGCIPQKINIEYSKFLDQLLSIEDIDGALMCTVKKKVLELTVY